MAQAEMQDRIAMARRNRTGNRGWHSDIKWRAGKCDRIWRGGGNVGDFGGSAGSVNDVVIVPARRQIFGRGNVDFGGLSQPV